ncbi:MAG: hypothetical protein MHM6MM_001819 [Cercozoa sp. M6MM]
MLRLSVSLLSLAVPWSKAHDVSHLLDKVVPHVTPGGRDIHTQLVSLLTHEKWREHDQPVDSLLRNGASLHASKSICVNDDLCHVRVTARHDNKPIVGWKRHFLTSRETPSLSAVHEVHAYDNVNEELSFGDEGFDTFWRLTDQEAREAALGASVMHGHDAVARMYIRSGNKLRPTIKIRTLGHRPDDIVDVSVDAQTGEVYRFGNDTDLATNATDAINANTSDFVFDTLNVTAQVWERAHAEGEKFIERKSTDLIDVYNSTDGYLNGKFFNVHSCCVAYVCTGDFLNRTDCPLTSARCAENDDDEDLVMKNEVELQLPVANFVGWNIAGMFPNDFVYVKGPACTGLKRVKINEVSDVSPEETVMADFQSSLNKTWSGLTEKETNAWQGDKYSEVQLYDTLTRFFQHVRDVIGDETWCLGGLSQLCDADGEPLGSAGALDVFTNVAFIPAVYELILAEVINPQGKGATAEDPLVFDMPALEANAFFLPALLTDEFEDEVKASPFLSTWYLTRNRNLLGFFQGEGVDFAYDVSVVAHELVHAVVYALSPDLGSYGLDGMGSHAEPGALNEGWADYFAASWLNAANIGSYAITAIDPSRETMRDARNDNRCPNNVMFEVHQDAKPWTAALWEIREAVPPSSRATLDRLLLMGVALAEEGEPMATAALRVMALLSQTEFVGSVRAFQTAIDTFERRGIYPPCKRSLPVEQAGAATVLLPSPLELGFYSVPTPFQLQVQVPAGASNVVLQWRRRDFMAQGFWGSKVYPGIPTSDEVVQGVPSWCELMYTYSHMGDLQTTAWGCDLQSSHLSHSDTVLRRRLTQRFPSQSPTQQATPFASAWGEYIDVFLPIRFAPRDVDRTLHIGLINSWSFPLSFTATLTNFTAHVDADLDVLLTPQAPTTPSGGSTEELTNLTQNMNNAASSLLWTQLAIAVPLLVATLSLVVSPTDCC